MHLFYNMFLAQMPIMHVATFTIEGKPPVLLSAMQACGALYVKTRGAMEFINETLASARDQLVSEFVRGCPPSSHACQPMTNADWILVAESHYSGGSGTLHLGRRPSADHRAIPPTDRTT